MQSRLIHFELGVDKDEWLKWAYEAGIDSRVTSYVNFAPDKLHLFDPNHNDKTFQCPRTWYFMSEMIKDIAKLDYSYLPLLEGTIGPGSREFLSYCELEKELPKLQDVIDRPLETKVPDEPSTKFFICGTLASKVTKSTLSPIVDYLNRFPIEFQIVCFKDMLQRDKELRLEPALRSWLTVNAQELFKTT